MDMTNETSPMARNSPKKARTYGIVHASFDNALTSFRPEYENLRAHRGTGPNNI
jgi:hypothetical protein